MAIIGLFWGSIALASPAYAESYEVTASVPAPLPTSAPVITSPIDQQRFTFNSITVEGTCSADTAYITIERNGIIAGTAPCISGQFSLQITLFPNANTLIAHSFSSTDGAGPSSAPITVYWDILLSPDSPAPTQPPSPRASPLLPPAFATPTPPPSAGTGEPLYLTYDPPHYIVHHPGETWSWLFTVHGGTAPYAFSIEWDDDTTTSYTPDSNNHITVEHIYQQDGIFIPVARVVDARGYAAELQFFAVSRSDTTPTSFDPPPYFWVIIILLVLLLILFVLFDIELLIASIIQLLRRRQ